MRRSTTVLLVAGLAFIGLALLTSQRVPDWVSDAAIWASAQAVEPADVRVLINLGVVAQKRGDAHQARVLYARALTIAERQTTWQGPDRRGAAIALMNIATLDGGDGAWSLVRERVEDAHRWDATVHQPELEAELFRRGLQEYTVEAQ